MEAGDSEDSVVFQNNENLRTLLGLGVGTGITSKFSEAGGEDILIVYNSDRCRMAGREVILRLFILVPY